MNCIFDKVGNLLEVPITNISNDETESTKDEDELDTDIATINSIEVNNKIVIKYNDNGLQL